MNHTYCLVWNDQTQRRVPAPESARGRGKSKGQALKPAALLLGAAILLPAFAQAAGTLAANALPTGAQVVAGQAGVAQSGSQMTVTQGSDKAIINWQSFNIGSNAAVQFIQPSTSAVALNRVIAGDASQIHGKLSANGQVWLINLNGVLFGKGSQVDVGGLVASTLSITDADFLAGKAVFSRNGAKGGIVNQGEITAADGGLVALLAPTVSNEGIVTARLGSVVMAAGDRITLDAGANGLLQVAVDPATVKTLIENKQLIVADGGQAIMTGKAADALSASVVANTGTIQARSIAAREGRILLIADMEHGETQVGGTLDASAPAGGNGGFIETSAAHVTVANSALITTKAASGQSGTWLIDPNDFTIAASGGNMTGAAVSAALQNNGNFTIETATQGTAGGNGDIRVNDAVTWSANSTLTLKAERNIDINAVVSVNGDGKLAMNYGSAGNINTPGFSGRVNFEKSGSGLLTVNGQGYDVIKDVTALQAINSGLGGKYALGADIDVGNFTPIGDNSTDSDASRFTGTFDGLGHVIRNLVIDQPAMRFVGLFGATGNSSVIRNVGLEGGSVKGGYVVGGLVGYNMGRISASYATGSVSASALTFNDSAAGGLVGRNSGSISASYATGTVSASASGGGNASAGGLVGYNDGSIGDSYATGSPSDATGPVSASASGGGNASAGGLVGGNNGSIGASYATGSVNASASGGGYASAGGLVGENVGSISASYATGSAIASGGSLNRAGGLVGVGDNGGTITGAFYATTDVNGNVINHGGVADGDWSGNALGTGKSLADLKKAGTFAAWGAKVDDRGGSGAVWRIYEGNTTPLLRSFLTALTVDAGTLADRVYDGSAASGTVGSYTPSVSGAQPAGSLSYTAVSKNAGTYRTSDGSLRLGGLYSDQRGYDISYAGSSLTVTPAALTVTTGAVTKTYDGTTAAAGSAIASAGTQLFGGDTLSGGSFAFTDRNAGSGKTVRVSGVTINDGNGGNNYTVSYADNTASTIDKAALTVTTGAVTKTYDGTTAAAGSAIVSGGQLFGDTLSGGSFAFTDRNAGSGKTVRVSGVTINDGNGGNNYTVTYADNTASAIDKAALTVTTGAVTKTYDGTTAA
ncbi:MAG: filamentous hemagglutinin N-terminal domain-containing protein, partial [Candidatus Accumulibacter sp.]|nr:filamentous hemagglutinin N-terminal domain-containing protein [Accumulibacter sp.]